MKRSRLWLQQWVQELATNLILNNSRYHKIIIMTDADVDGAHIRTLIFTFLYRYLNNLLRRLCLYCPASPLPGQACKGIYYAYNDRELEKLKTKQG